MNIEIIYSKSSLVFLDTNGDKISRDASDLLIVKAIKKIYKIEVVSIDVKMLKGESGLYRIRKGNIRIIFHIDKNRNVTVVSVNEIDFRGSVC